MADYAATTDNYMLILTSIMRWHYRKWMSNRETSVSVLKKQRWRAWGRGGRARGKARAKARERKIEGETERLLRRLASAPDLELAYATSKLVGNPAWWQTIDTGRWSCRGEISTMSWRIQKQFACVRYRLSMFRGVFNGALRCGCQVHSAPRGL